MKGEKTKQTEIGEIPESWEVKNFSELCNFSAGRTPPRNKNIYWKNGIIPWMSISDMKQGALVLDTKEKVSVNAMADCFSQKKVKKGTLLMSFKLTIERTCFAGRDLVHNEAIISIQPNKELNKIFLSYYLPSIDYKEYQDCQIKGNTLNKAKISRIKIPTPPLPEQKKIATVLTKIQKNIEIKDKLIKTTQELKKSTMKYLFTYGTRGEKTKQTEIGEIPESWEVSTFERSVKKIKVDRKFQVQKNSYLKNGKFPVIDQGQSFISGWTDNASLLFKRNLPIIIFGDHTRIFKYVEDPFVLGADGTKLIAPISSYDTKFFYYFFLSKDIPSKGYSHHYKLLKEFLIPFPPLPEQKKIASILSKINERIKNYEKQKASLQALFKSMLNKLMTGQIRVHNLDIETSEVEK